MIVAVSMSWFVILLVIVCFCIFNSGCCLGFAYLCLVFFFFKQKTADEMRISDWSSDVCSSDLGFTQLLGGSGYAVAEQGAGAYSLQKLPQGDGNVEIGRASCRERVCQYV